MEIRKEFKVEMAHIVRNCSTDRCKKSIHGHSAVIEVFLTSDKLDNSGMILDFSLIKKGIGAFIDSFDHCLVLWSKDDKEYLKNAKKWSDRWIELGINPSAENFALLFCKVANEILESTEFCNGEGHVICSKVIYHETKTGYAVATKEDCLEFMPHMTSMVISPAVSDDWPQELYEFMTFGEDKKSFKNPKVKLQVTEK